jgi:hypothetical protein
MSINKTSQHLHFQKSTVYLFDKNGLTQVYHDRSEDETETELADDNSHSDNDETETETTSNKELVSKLAIDDEAGVYCEN